MSKPTRYSRFVRFANGFRASWVVQMCFFLISAAPPRGMGYRLEPQDTVLINFPQRYNRSGPALRYLPPEVPDYFLPEVIDNRARNTTSDVSDNVTATIDENVPSLSDLVLQLPPRNDARESRYYRRPGFLQSKHGARVIMGQPVPISDADQSSGATIKVNEMSCQNTGEEVFFRATVKAARAVEAPVIDNIENSLCKMTRIRDEYSIDFGRNQFRLCGVTDCSTEADRSYCLDLRFPVISGLKLKGDTKVTLRCKVQERTASHTKRIGVKTLDATARAAPTVVTGGFKNALETDVGLFRKTYTSENVFDSRIQSGGTVILGEEILLRVLVRDSDGWRYSKISDVTIHYVENRERKKIMNSVTILDADGCLNPSVREVCSREQYRVSPLETYLIFQAFMFESMKESDEMVLSVKVTGCLEGADCVLNCPAGHVRRSRSVASRNGTVDWQDNVIFRVALSKGDTERLHDIRSAMPYALFACALLIIIALISTIRLLTRRRIK